MIKVSISAGNDVKSVKVALIGVIGGVPIPFPVPHPEACSYPPSKLVCPLKANEKQKFHMALPVRKEYPAVCITLSMILTCSHKCCSIIRIDILEIIINLETISE